MSETLVSSTETIAITDLSIPNIEVIEEQVPKEEHTASTARLIDALSKIDIFNYDLDLVTADALTNKIPRFKSGDNDPGRRLEMDKYSQAKNTATRLAEEFRDYLEGYSHSFRAYFVLCEKLHFTGKEQHKDAVQDRATVASIHTLSHQAFLDELGITYDELTANHESGVAKIAFGRDEDIGRGADTILEARFQTHEGANSPFAIFYYAERDGLPTNNPRYVLTPRTLPDSSVAR